MATVLSNNAHEELTQPHVEDMDRESTMPRLLAAEQSKELVHIFKLLADETRLQIIHFLSQQKELNVRSICKLLGQSQPSVSHHLALLKVAGILAMRREGKHNFYSLVHENIDKLKLLIDSALPA